MNHLHLPSGLNCGIALLIDKGWTPEQALAVVELLDDLREVIVRHYQPQLQRLLQQDQCQPVQSDLPPFSEGDPF
jgi:hypothetical protein